LKTGSPLTLSKLTARSPATFYGQRVHKKNSAAAGAVRSPLKGSKTAVVAPSPSKATKGVSLSSSLLKKVLVANQLIVAAAASTPNMTPRGQIRVLASKTPRSSAKKAGGSARRLLWSEVVAKNKDIKHKPIQVRLGYKNFKIKTVMIRLY
jgi:hypothetical protein